MADTIFALATPPGRSGVAVIRVSGAGAIRSAALLGADRLLPRQASLRTLVNPRNGAMLDRAIVLRFKAPASFTGEDVVEFHVHGGAAVVRGVSSALAAMPDLRQAEPGEFTRRALTNGKVDLAQVEGLGDLLLAETEMQAQQALALIDGRLSKLTAEWRGVLLRALAYLDASIDFADEDLPADLLANVGAQLDDLRQCMERELSASGVTERIRLGFEVALVGAPNVGKSTLLNAIAGRDVALTSEHAGTTRDVLEVRMDLRGLPVSILDTAGMRSADDPVETLGVDRARLRAARADLRVFLLEDAADAATLGIIVQPGDVIALAKADLQPGVGGHAVSGLTGQGVGRLLDAIAGVLGDRAGASGSVGNERQRDAVGEAHECVCGALGYLRPDAAQVELASAEVRAALGALDFLVGKVDVERVLDVVFASFCLGK